MTARTIVDKIQTLKRERNAIILAHNYQPDEVQAIADFIGDSLALSRTAAKTDAAVIVFCGVHFMAETAAILSPHKTVLMPEPDAGCPMADMISAAQLRAFKQEHPGALVVAYVNSSAAVKAESDICCTSSNAQDVVQSLPEDRDIIFIPDKYLGSYVAAQTGRKLILWNGYCPIHVKIQPEDIERRKREHPAAKVAVHPECTPPVIQRADAVLSTEGICRYAGRPEVKELIVGTEIGVLYRLRTEHPEKRFYPASDTAVCPNMKKTTLEKVLWSLERMEHIVSVPPDIATRARQAVDAMIAIGT
ncbi:MAG: quinolinate synthase NadA [Desulfobacterota bacterium]|nr:quinolinate synthase NadA [Thermodesulfobacteriota bacterium]